MSDKHESGILGDAENSKDAPANRDVAALFSNLQLNPEQYQAFDRRRPAKISQNAADIPRRESPLLPSHANGGPTGLHIGVFSPMGGAGTSTLTASVGSILCELGRRVLLVDTSQWQALAFSLRCERGGFGCAHICCSAPSRFGDTYSGVRRERLASFRSGQSDASPLLLSRSLRTKPGELRGCAR